MSVLFSVLWANHPAVKGVIDPCKTNGTANFEDQCAIRMGVCLEDSGVSTKTFTGARCYPGHGHKQSHILRAEELARWLEKQKHLFGLPTKEKRVTSNDYKSKTGIVLLRNFWGVGNQGDHIDLWNGMTLTRGGASYFAASKEVWFWEVR